VAFYIDYTLSKLDVKDVEIVDSCLCIVVTGQQVCILVIKSRVVGGVLFAVTAPSNPN